MMRKRTEGSSLYVALIIATLGMISGESLLYGQKLNSGLFLKVQGGVSSYIGDNNTSVFNTGAFLVNGKWPYQAGIEMGYQWASRWRGSINAVFADYPVITRFYEDVQVEAHPTKRTSYQLILNYMLAKSRLRSYAIFGVHLTFGNVSIFEVDKLVANQPPEIHNHYMWGPVFGLGVEYTLSESVSLVGQLSTNLTFLDDSADGRLPLGPPQPTNLKEKDRFGPFDMLSGISIGLLFKPTCVNGCRPSEKNRKAKDHTLTGRSMFRMSRLLNASLTTISYQYSPFKMDGFYFGIETGLGPKNVFIRYLYANGSEKTDDIYFSDAFAGLTARFYKENWPFNRTSAHVGTMAAVPRQGQFTAGIDYQVLKAFAVGVEARYALCPRRKQVFYQNEVVYLMNSSCEYKFGMGITGSYRL